MTTDAGGSPPPGSPPRWALTLYVNGASSLSLQAIANIRALCDSDLAGQVDLEIIDVREQPALVVRDQVIATPTLIKTLPEPLRRLIGDLSDADRVRLGLDLGPDRRSGVADGEE